MTSLKQTVSSNERKFIVDALKQGLRVDGRSPKDLRNIKLKFISGGQVEVLYGKTRAMAKVTADIVRPFPDRPAEGFLAFFVNFSPMASATFELGRQSDAAVETARVIERGLRESRALDTEALCILAGEKVWSVRCDIHILDHDGNLMDCANFAAVSALSHFRRPDVTVVGDVVTVHSVDDRQPVPLALHHIPISVTFAFFTDDTQVWSVMDPTLKEQLVSESQLTLTLNANKELCCIQKAGGVSVPKAQILTCANLAGAKAIELTQLLKGHLKADEAKPVRRTNLTIATPAKKRKEGKAVEAGGDGTAMAVEEKKEEEDIEAPYSPVDETEAEEATRLGAPVQPPSDAKPEPMEESVGDEAPAVPSQEPPAQAGAAESESRTSKAGLSKSAKRRAKKAGKKAAP